MGFIFGPLWKPKVEAGRDGCDVGQSAVMSVPCLTADVAVIGGGVGGCAAALAALEGGCRVILTEETQWLGGQLTSQMVPPDEHGWIEQFGRTATYQRFREEVRTYYLQHYPLRPEARRSQYLNPGNGWVSPLCHEPRVALAVLNAMLAPYRGSGRLLVLLNHRPVEVIRDGADRISVVRLAAPAVGSQCEVAARYFLDATELGDLLELASVEHVTGQESREQTGEPNAPAVARPDNVQAFSWCFALEHREGEDHVGDPPPAYDYWKQFWPQLQPAWPGPLLSWTGLNPRTMKPVNYRFEPHGEDPAQMSGLWSYRRVIDREKFMPGFFASDIVVVNWPMIDYLSKSLLSSSHGIRQEAGSEAKALSRSVFYWMQTEAPRPDGGIGWPGLRLCGDGAGSPDGLAMAPYVRESRRIRAEFTVREQDVAQECRLNDRLGECFEDSVGVGHYRIDLHPSSGGDNYIDVASLPFRIPLGAMIPVRMENLLPAAKNIGTTHITNGCYRLHPVEWNIGEAAGALAVFCLHHDSSPREVYRDPDRRSTFQRMLERRGVELQWPEDLDLAEGDPHVHVCPGRFH